MKFDGNDEVKALTAIAQSRNGQVFLDALKRRRENLINSWLVNIDSNHGAHMRGKVSEVSELIQYVETLSQSKE